MKELSIEEKAKAYDEVVEKFKYVINQGIAFSKEDLQDLFPELKESEDEQIRKALIEGFNEYNCYFFNGIEKEKIIDWLEKQKTIDVLDEEEREFADNVDSYRKEVDAAYQKGYNEGVKATLEKQGEPVEINPTEFDTRLQALIGKFDSLPKEELIGSLSFWMNVVQNDGTYKSDEKQSEQDNDEDSNILQRFSFYSYKDEPNILYLSGLYVNEEYRNKGIGTKILEVADEVAKNLNCHTIRLKTKKDSNAERLYRIHGYNSLVTKESDEIWLEKQRDLLFQKMKEADYEWDSEKKELKKMEQNLT